MEAMLPQETAGRQADRSKIVRDMLTGESTYATTLLVWAIDTYGMECLSWCPETLKMELEDDYAVVIPKANFDRLMAGIAILTTDMFFKEVSRFIQIANVLAGDDFQPDEFEPADSVECAWAITESLLIWPPEDDDPELFCDEIRHYIGAVLKADGFVSPPDVLRIAIDADWRDQVSYDFSDDPEMFAMINSVQQDKKREVESILQTGLRDLVAQISALPLRNGDSKEFIGRLNLGGRT